MTNTRTEDGGLRWGSELATLEYEWKKAEVVYQRARAQYALLCRTLDQLRDAAGEAHERYVDACHAQGQEAGSFLHAGCRSPRAVSSE